MNKGDIATVQDLINLEDKLMKGLSGLIKKQMHPLKLFYTTKEWMGITGKKYQTIVDHCQKGKLKAYQESPNGTWLIHGTELERLEKAAEANVSGE